jgi:hypothetical protein
MFHVCVASQGCDIKPLKECHDLRETYMPTIYKASIMGAVLVLMVVLGTSDVKADPVTYPELTS